MNAVRSIRLQTRPLAVVCALALCSVAALAARAQSAQDSVAVEEASVNVHYLEIVTADMNATCEALEKLHGVTFGAPDPGLGNARTAALDDGGRIGVREPMGAQEQPVVRPYLGVSDVEAAVRAAEAAGAAIAMPATELPGHGTFAIYLLGGIQHGLWQVPE